VRISTSLALVIYTVVMSGGMVFATFYENVPFLAFATQFTIGFVAYVTKRLVQKRREYNGK